MFYVKKAAAGKKFPHRLENRKWSGGESNSRPQHCERCALPTELSPRFKHPNPGRLRNSMFSIVYPHCPICQGVGSTPSRKFSVYTQDFSQENPSLRHFRGENRPEADTEPHASHSEGLAQSKALGKKTLGGGVLNGRHWVFLARPSLKARASQWRRGDTSPLHPPVLEKEP